MKILSYSQICFKLHQYNSDDSVSLRNVLLHASDLQIKFLYIIETIDFASEQVSIRILFYIWNRKQETTTWLVSLG